MKKVIFILFVFLTLFIYTACENGVSFEALDELIQGESSEEEDTVITDPDSGKEEEESEEEDLDNTEHTGSNVFSYSLTSSNAPENMNYSEPVGIYARLEDTSGYGYTAMFNLSLVLPENAGNAEGVTVQIHDYTPSEGDEDSLSASFADGAKKHTFTGSNTSAEVSVQVAEKRMSQGGELKISFSYDPDVYSDSVPTTMFVLFKSKGNNEKRHIAIKSVRETSDQPYSKIYEGVEAMTWNVAITDSEGPSPSQWYDIPLSIDLYNIEKDAPLTLSASSVTGLELKSYSITNPNAEGEASITLVMRANEFGIAEPITSSATLTLNSEHTDIYAGLPLDITLNTERKEFFEYYASDYVNTFTTASSGSKKDENGKYYTAIRLPGATSSQIEKNKTINYVIRRIDDTSDEKKVIREGSFVSNEGFTYWDRDALILTKKAKYELEIISGSTSLISTTMKEGARNLTHEELLLSMQENMRYALIDRSVHYDVSVIQGGMGTIDHDRWYNAWPVSWDHVYKFSNYWPYFMRLNGNLSYECDVGGYQAWEAEDAINTNNASWPAGQAPFAGIILFYSSYGEGAIQFNNIHITDNNWNSPAWLSGSFNVTAHGTTKSFDKNSGVPFGLYMDKATFLSKIAPGGVYTQK